MESVTTGETRYLRPEGLWGAEFACASYGRHEFPRHFHEEYVVAIMVRGVERLSCGRRSELAPAGSLVLVNPGQVHANGAVDDAGFAYRTLYLPVPLVMARMRGAGAAVAVEPAGELEFADLVTSDRRTFTLLRELHAAVEAGEPLLRSQSLLSAALMRLFLRHGARRVASAEWEPPAHSGLARAREYLDAHFADDVSLGDLSQVAGLSTFHLVRSFGREVGLSPWRYLIHRRVLHAVGLLRQGVPIAHAACAAGFADQSHLNRHFKRLVGATPGQFRGLRKSVQDGARRHAG